MQTLQLAKALEAGRGSESHKGSVMCLPVIQEVSVVCYFECDPQVVKDFSDTGAKIICLGLSRSISPWSLLSVVSGTFRRLRPDIIHIQYMAPGFLAVVAARLAAVRFVVATVHQPWTLTHHGVKAKILLRAAASMCNSFIAVSEAAERSWFGASQIYSSGKSRTRACLAWGSQHFTIHNTIDVARVDQILSSFNRTDLRDSFGFGECIVIGAVSRLSPEKGMDVLVEAFSQVCKRLTQSGDAKRTALHNVESDRKDGEGTNLKVALVIVGDGQERVRLEEQAGALGLCSADFRGWRSGDHRGRGTRGSFVVWLGKRNWEDAIKLMSVMDICVVPSRFEGFGLTAAEAMACGKPVVAADVGGLPEVVGRDNSCGRLYPTESVEGLVQGLTELVLSKQKREALGNRGRVRVESLFGLERFKESIGGLYQEILGE